MAFKIDWYLQFSIVFWYFSWSLTGYTFWGWRGRLKWLTLRVWVIWVLLILSNIFITCTILSLGVNWRNLPYLHLHSLNYCVWKLNIPWKKVIIACPQKPHIYHIFWTLTLTFLFLQLIISPNKVVTIKEMMANSRSHWLLEKFSM